MILATKIDGVEGPWFSRGTGGMGGQLSLIEFFAGSRTMFHLLPIRGNLGIRKSLVEAVAKFYYDEPKSSVLTPPLPHSSSQAMNDDKTKSWCVVLSLYKTHCLKITCTQT